MGVKSVFLSFASEDAAWKQNFAHRLWFSDLLGNVEVRDYQMGGNLPFGPLEEWLETEVNEAAAFIAIVSHHYIAKKYPLREWWTGLSAKAQHKLIFVPVMIDAHAKDWWADLKTSGRLRELELDDDYAYADFTNGRGGNRHIIGEYGPITEVTQSIKELALLIRDHLSKMDLLPHRPIASDDRLTGSTNVPVDTADTLANFRCKNRRSTSASPEPSMGQWGAI